MSLFRKKKGLQPNSTSVYECFRWKFAVKTHFCDFDVIWCFFSKNLMFFEDPLLASLVRCIVAVRRTVNSSSFLYFLVSCLVLTY